MIDPITRLSADPENGVVVLLETEAGSMELTAGGTEIGNWLGFFNQKDCSGVEAEIRDMEIACAPTAVKTRYVVTLPEATFEVSISESAEKGAWLRHASVTALRPSWIGDFVLRLGVRSAEFFAAGDGRRMSKHKKRNTYHQFPVDTVEMVASERVLRTSQRSNLKTGRLKRVSYWRDQLDGQWIQHHRLIVDRSDLDHVVFRMRNRVYDTRYSAWLRYPILRAPFWALNENILSHFPVRILPTIQAQGVVCMAEGERIELAARVTVEKREEAGT